MAKRRPESELPWTVEAFDRWHAQRPERWELILGVPVMIAPATNRHSIIKLNIARHLANKLEGTRCTAMVDGPEVKVKWKRLSAIPDVLVTCSPIDLERGTIDEPVVLVEVVSPSSQRDDTGRKWLGYRVIPSLRHYLVVQQETRFATLHSRTGDIPWSTTDYQEGEVVLDAIGVSLSFEEIYRGVIFPVIDLEPEGETAP